MSSTWKKFIGISLYTETALKHWRAKQLDLSLTGKFFPKWPISTSFVYNSWTKTGGRLWQPHSIYRNHYGQVFFFLYFSSSFGGPLFIPVEKKALNFNFSWWFASQPTQLAEPLVPRPPQNIKMSGNLKEVPLVILTVEAFCFHLLLFLKQFFRHSFQVPHYIFLPLAVLPRFPPPPFPGFGSHHLC